MPRVKDRVRSEDVTLDEDLTFADLQLPVRAASAHAARAPRRPSLHRRVPDNPDIRPLSCPRVPPQEAVVRGLNLSGFTIPSPVQRAAIPLGRLGADLVVQAKSGTGKTVTFGAILCERVDRSSAYPQALVLAPTREVALQSRDALDKLARALDPPALRVACFLGGLPVADDRAALASGCQLCVGTPGRVRQLLEEGSMAPGGIRTLVIDEADALVGGAFEHDVLFCHSMLPERKQVMAFSATYPSRTLARIETMTRSPQRVAMCSQNTAALRAVRQHYLLVDVPGGDRGASRTDVALAKESALKNRVFAAVAFHQAVVFCRSAGRGEALTRRLTAEGYPAVFTAGTLPQRKRMDAMDAMRGFRARVLVSTDLTARGVDLERVNLVTHLDVPRDASTYAHRVGRTGRFGTAGLSVTVVTREELSRLRELLASADGVDVALEPLPETVPADWYDYELDDDDVPLASKTGAGGTGGGTTDVHGERKTRAGGGVGSSKGRSDGGEAADESGRRSAGRGGFDDEVYSGEASVSGEASGRASGEAYGEASGSSGLGNARGGDEVREEGFAPADGDDDDDDEEEWRKRREWASWWWWWWRDRAGWEGSRGRREAVRSRDVGDDVPWIVPPLHSSLRAGAW